MGLSREAIEDELYATFSMAGTNSSVIFEYGNAPRPEKPYTSLRLLSFSQNPDLIEKFNQDTNLLEYYGTFRMVYTVNCFSDSATGAQNEANRLKAKLQTNLIRQRLRQNLDISFLSTNDLTDFTQLIGADYESRATFEVVFDVLLEDGSTSEDLGYFDSVGYISIDNNL